MILATLRAVGLGRPYPPPPEPLRRRPRACAGGCNGRQRPSLGAGCEPLPDAGTKRLLRLLVFGRLDAALTGGTSILSWASCSETVEWAILPPTIAAAPAAITLPRGLSRAQNRLPWARFPFTPTMHVPFTPRTQNRLGFRTDRHQTDPTGQRPHLRRSMHARRPWRALRRRVDWP